MTDDLSERLCDRAPLRSYRPHGFVFAHRFAHDGPILILLDGVHAWPVRDAGSLSAEDFAPIFGLAGQIDFLLLGTGKTQIFPDAQLRGKFAENGLGLEVMATDAACRTYNLLLEEERQFAAALFPG